MDAVEQEIDQRTESETRIKWLPADETADKLLIVNWDDEAERARMNDALTKFDRNQLIRPPGTVRILTDSIDAQSLLDALLNKVPVDHVSIYELEEADIDGYLDSETTLLYTFAEPPTDIDAVVNYVITQHGGRQISPSEKRYELTRHGYVEVGYTVKDDTTVEFDFIGQSDPVQALKGAIERGLKEEDSGRSGGEDE